MIDQIKTEIEAFRNSAPNAADTPDFLVIEAALLLETDIPELCDHMWYVFAPEDTRIERLIGSRGYSVEKCRAIMAKQRSVGDFFQAATAVIPTGYGFDVTRARVRQILTSIVSD